MCIHLHVGHSMRGSCGDECAPTRCKHMNICMIYSIFENSIYIYVCIYGKRFFFSGFMMSNISLNPLTLFIYRRLRRKSRKFELAFESMENLFGSSAVGKKNPLATVEWLGMLEILN